MAADARPPRRRLSPLAILLAAVVVAAIVVGGILIFGGGDDDDNGGENAAEVDNEQVAKDLREGRVLAGPSSAPFAMRYTKNWEILPPSALESEDSEVRPLAGLRRKDRSAAIFISVGGPIRGGISSLEDRLPRELEKRYDDFDLQGIRRIEVAAGPALFTTWLRTKRNQVQSNLVVPVSNKRSFSVDTVVTIGSDTASAEAGAMQRTFDTAPAG